MSTGYFQRIGNVIISHGIFFSTLPLVTISLAMDQMDRSLGEAAQTLGAGPRTTFRTVTLPLLLPSIITGYAAAFVLSLNEYIIAFLVAGFAVETLPIKVFNSLRYGFTPTIAAPSRWSSSSSRPPCSRCSRSSGACCGSWAPTPASSIATADDELWFATREHQPGVAARGRAAARELLPGRRQGARDPDRHRSGDRRHPRHRRPLTDLDVAVVNTHYHWDHSGGNSAFDDIAIHELGADRLRSGPDKAKLEPYAAYTLRMLERFGDFRATDEEFFGFLANETTPRTLPDDFDFAAWKIPPSIPTRLLRDGDRLDLGDGRSSPPYAGAHARLDLLVRRSERPALRRRHLQHGTDLRAPPRLGCPRRSHAPRARRGAGRRGGVRLRRPLQPLRRDPAFLRRGGGGIRPIVAGEASFEKAADEGANPGGCAFERFGVLVPS